MMEKASEYKLKTYPSNQLQKVVSPSAAPQKPDPNPSFQESAVD